MRLQRAEILSRERFGNHLLLRYRWNGCIPQPGQFVMVRTRSFAAALDPFLCRPFFVHDYDGESAALLVEIRGRGTSLLAGEEEEVVVSEPLGRGFDIGNGPVALVGGGVWVSPLKLLSRRLAGRGIPHELYLEIPSTAPEAYGDVISRIFPDADLVPTDDPERAPEKLLARVGDLSRYSAVCASGPLSTLAAVKRAACEQVCVQLAVRERMACANGSCHGCAVPVWDGGGRTYARACISGPVFLAEVLAW